MANPGDPLAALFDGRPDRVLAAGDTLFRLGDTASHVYLIRTGRLRLVRPFEQGDAVTIHVGQAGELFAEAALFATTYHCDALADAPSRVAACGTAELHRALADPAIAAAWIERLTGQLHAARTRLALRAVRSARARVLQHLHLSAGPGADLVLEGRLRDVAAELGLTPEAYSRTLAALQKAGAIRRSGLHIHLTSKAPPCEP